jgi:hypothetical protein
MAHGFSRQQIVLWGRKPESTRSVSEGNGKGVTDREDRAGDGTNQRMISFQEAWKKL